MPFATDDDLPESVRRALPHHARDIFLAAFNAAFAQHAADSDREAVAFRIAWAAVKRQYRKIDGGWAPRVT